MRLHRFIGQFDLNLPELEIEDREIINQVKNVFRLSESDEFILSDGRGAEARVKILKISKNSLTVQVLEKYKNNNEAEVDVTLYCAILKRENFELVVQKATELGVKKIVPLITNRTVKLGLKMERLEKIVKEAAEQSGRAVVPMIGEPVDLKIAINLAKINDLNLFFHISKETGRPSVKESNVGIFIGPEGGWDDSEIEQARQAGFKMVSLGKLTLRAETAAIAALAKILI